MFLSLIIVDRFKSLFQVKSITCLKILLVFEKKLVVIITVNFRALKYSVSLAGIKQLFPYVL